MFILAADPELTPIFINGAPDLSFILTLSLPLTELVICTPL